MVFCLPPKGEAVRGFWGSMGLMLCSIPRIVSWGVAWVFYIVRERHFKIYGDNIVECERAIDLIVDSFGIKRESVIPIDSPSWCLCLTPRVNRISP
jgi:hypothetical protein